MFSSLEFCFFQNVPVVNLNCALVNLKMKKYPVFNDVTQQSHFSYGRLSSDKGSYFCKLVSSSNLQATRRHMTSSVMETAAMVYKPI